MTKRKVKAPKPPKSPTVKDAAKNLAAARKRLADAEELHGDCIEALAASLRELLDATAAVTESEVAFEELAIAQARKKYGVPEEGIVTSATESGCNCCPIRTMTTDGGLTYNVAKPPPCGGSAVITLH